MRKTLRITLDVLVSDLSPAERAETVDEFNPTPLPGLRSRDISARAIADLIEGAIPVSSDEAFAGSMIAAKFVEARVVECEWMIGQKWPRRAKPFLSSEERS